MSDEEMPPKQEASVSKKNGNMIEVNSLGQIIDVTGRSCRLCNSEVTGSAFLIAPDLAMTAFHVVNAIWETPGDNVWIEFYETTEGPTKRDPVKIEQANVIAHDLKLDYAVIRLPKSYGLQRYEQAASRMRGWFSLSDARSRLMELEKPMALLHFPVVRDNNVVLNDPRPGKPLFVVSEGTLTRKVKDRFYHSAATEDGSSGGLCFINRTMTPLALHIATHGNENVAVEMAMIIEHIETHFPHLSAELFSTPLEKLCPRISRDEKPILNRDDVILKLIGMMAGLDTRPLYVFGSHQSGRTFINKIVEAFRPNRLHARIEISTLGQHPSIIREIAKRILGSSDNFAPYETIETFASYFRRGIGNLLYALDQQAAHRYTVAFVFFDGFDVVDEASADLFTHISGLASQLKNVRIALSGSIETPVGATVEKIVLGPIKAEDFERLAEQYCIYHELGLDNDLRNEAVKITLDSIDFANTSLVTHADRAHALCNSLRELAVV